MKHYKPVLAGAAAIAALLLGACAPSQIDTTPTVAPLAGAVFMGDRASTHGDLPDLLPPVDTFDEAISQCETVFPAGTEQSDCINAAIAEWGMFEPLEEGAVVVEPEPVEAEEVPAEPMEDEPGFDCRIHGNQVCGVEIMGTWYVVQFDGGEPVGVVAR